MTLLPPLKLSDPDKLESLRRLDHFRDWHSLDEKRYCLCCGAIIDGHSIQVVGGARGTGVMRIICPTPRCQAIPMDWVRPTHEMLAQHAAMKDVVVSLPTRKPVQSEPPKPESFWKSVQKFAAHFGRAA